MFMVTPQFFILPSHFNGAALQPPQPLVETSMFTSNKQVQALESETQVQSKKIESITKLLEETTKSLKEMQDNEKRTKDQISNEMNSMVSYFFTRMLILETKVYAKDEIVFHAYFKNQIDSKLYKHENYLCSIRIDSDENSAKVIVVSPQNKEKGNEFVIELDDVEHINKDVKRGMLEYDTVNDFTFKGKNRNKREHFYVEMNISPKNDEQESYLIHLKKAFDCECKQKNPFKTAK